VPNHRVVVRTADGKLWPARLLFKGKGYNPDRIIKGFQTRLPPSTWEALPGKCPAEIAGGLGLFTCIDLPDAKDFPDPSEVDLELGQNPAGPVSGRMQ
jgi:hypothetical protein